MKFLLISDLHENIDAFKWINPLEDQVDEVLFLGDVSNCASDEKAIEILKMFKKKVYFIPGNLDMKTLPEAASEVTHSVHGKAFEINGIKFAALGGSNPTIFNTPFELSEKDIENMLDPISSEGMVLMTHAPSHGIHDKITIGLHVGSPAVKKIVEKYKPIVALSGHIHEAFGIKEKNGTLFINPGPAKEDHAAILEIKDGKASAWMVGPADL